MNTNNLSDKLEIMIKDQRTVKQHTNWKCCKCGHENLSAKWTCRDPDCRHDRCGKCKTIM